VNTIRVLIMAGAVVAAFATFGLWRRAPRLTRVDPEAIGASGPAIVQFGTPTCGPCKRARPLLEQVARDSGVEFVDVDLTARPDLASRYHIRSVPVVLVTAEGGSVLGRWTGVPPGPEVRRLAALARAA